MREDQKKILDAITKELAVKGHKIEKPDVAKLDDGGYNAIISEGGSVLAFLRFHPEVAGNWRIRLNLPNQKPKEFPGLQYSRDADLQRVLQYVREQLPKKNEGD